MTTYEGRHDTQFEPRTWSSGLDCNMNAAADVARWWSLGLIDHTHDAYRAWSGDTEGGTNIDQAQHVLSKVGVPSVVWDRADNKTWADVLAHVRRGWPVIAHGDYGSVPRALRGPIDRTYTGFHAVVLARTATRSGVPSIRVGDGLSDPWMWWPAAVAERYMVDFPGGGLTYLTVRPRLLCAKVTTANVRATPSLTGTVFTTISPTSRVHVGGTVRGQQIGLNATWFRVWVKDRIGYVHSSVAKFA